MTAAEARESAAWHARKASELHADGTESPDWTGEIALADAVHHDRAAVALDAYADGIDAAPKPGPFDAEAALVAARDVVADWTDPVRADDLLSVIDAALAAGRGAR